MGNASSPSFHYCDLSFQCPQPDASATTVAPFVSTTTFDTMSLVDMDGDGDMDLVTTGYSAMVPTVNYFENRGGPTAVSFTQRTGADNNMCASAPVLRLHTDDSTLHVMSYRVVRWPLCLTGQLMWQPAMDTIPRSGVEMWITT